jgi:hypothetical protein
MAVERGRWLWRFDAFLWLLGGLLALAGVVDGSRSGRSLPSMLRSTWVYSSGLLLALAAVVAIVIVLRWRASRAMVDLSRKYPPAP